MYIVIKNKDGEGSFSYNVKDNYKLAEDLAIAFAALYRIGYEMVYDLSGLDKQYLPIVSISLEKLFALLR